AKDRYDKRSVDFGIVKRHFRENWDRYVPSVPGAKVYPTFAFLLDAPSTGLYAYSDGDEMGRSWGVFVNVADAANCRGPVQTSLPVPSPPRPCFTEEAFGGANFWWAWWNFVLVHELGHSFGLTHPHDTVGQATGGQLTYDLNWLWDSTASAMTYRHTLLGFDAFDKELVLRNHAASLALRALGAAAPPEAAERARRALALVAAGDYSGALTAAQASMAGLDLPEPLGRRGQPQSFSFDVAATRAPVGVLDPLALPVGLPVTLLPASRSFPIHLPANATAFELQVREADAPTHSGWAAYVLIADAAWNVVGALTNNGYDVGVWEALDRCLGACHGVLVPYGGAKSSYTVTVTPLFGEGPWPRSAAPVA
ncbi:MAG TPA: hypothetical protein VHI93_06800, partial [Candidatus Thermoplasmatota archaeon]|nr:hypothetical protein [Candidatus Thermoplasmatota archaeon]